MGRPTAPLDRQYVMGTSIAKTRYMKTRFFRVTFLPTGWFRVSVFFLSHLSFKRERAGDAGNRVPRP